MRSEELFGQFVHPAAAFASPIRSKRGGSIQRGSFHHDYRRQKEQFSRAFVDFFILFSGISTASNLARTQGRPLLTRGLFLFRKPAGQVNRAGLPKNLVQLLTQLTNW